jgi:murein DD-endopeptidase MepM/ murein hydrolase activator NlpD
VRDVSRLLTRMLTLLGAPFLALSLALPLALSLALSVSPSAGVAGSPSAGADDPRWVFYSRDTTAYSSPWWRGAHRTMIGYGCTRAPYYSPDPRCRDGHGFHHGVDYAMPCGTRLFAGRGGTVVSSAALGPAYGERPLLLRNRRLGVDFLVAHAVRVFVSPGDRVRRGDLMARASDSAAPDGCHLHIEVRTAGGGLSDARRPIRHLDLRAAS